MNFQYIEAYCRAGTLGLACYGLEKDCGLTLMHCSENATFLVSDMRDGKQRGVLRVSRPGYHSLPETEAEIAWLRQIREEGTVVIPSPIPCPDGRAVAVVTVDNQEYHLVLCEYLEGEAPDPEGGGRGFPWFPKIGETAAKLHKQTMEWTRSRRLCRPVWDFEALLGVHGLFGNWRECREITEAESRLLLETCGEIKGRLLAYGKDEKNFGLIHSDLRAANLLVDGDILKVLDFDDCGYGWHLFDLASSFSFIEDRPEVPGWIEEWLKGYERVLELEKRDYEMIPTFFMARRIQLLAWITSHDDSEPVRRYERGFARQTLCMAEEYLGKNRGWDSGE